MIQEIPFLDCYGLAECAAREFAEYRTAKLPDDERFRRYLRADPVRALRYLWRTGNAEQRSLVAARVAIWMKRPDVGRISNSVLERERARGENKSP